MAFAKTCQQGCPKAIHPGVCAIVTFLGACIGQHDCHHPAMHNWREGHPCEILNFCMQHGSWRRGNSWQPSWTTCTSSHHPCMPATSGMLSLPPLSARPGLLQTLAKREYIMPAAAPRHQAFASSARKFGAATSLPQSAGLLLWACRSATRAHRGHAGRASR